MYPARRRVFTQRSFCKRYDVSVPKVVDHTERRLMIVEATCAVIADRGIDAATIRGIAEQLGSTTGLVTHYFDSRDELLRSGLRHVHRAAGARMLRAIENAEPNDGLRAVIRESLPLDESRRSEWRIWLAFWGRAATNPLLATEQQDRYREWTALVSQLVGQQESAVDVETLIAVIDGLGTRATLDENNFPASRQLEIIDALIG